LGRVLLDRVRKVYGSGAKAFEAVKDFSLQINDGEFVVLVGGSGCGKSTTLRMIAGLEDITAGEIRIGDRVVNELHPKDRDIAMVFQNYALYPHMSVYRNLAFPLTMRGVDKATIDQRVREASRILALDPLLERRPAELSGGQRQRVAVGRAIVREPSVFLFDEPLSNLDAKLRVTTRAELKALHQRLKTTTVYVTHDQEEAMTLGDRIVVMANGVIQQAGTPLEVYRRPANKFVAGFIGLPPMNMLDGVVEGDGAGGAFFVTKEQSARVPMAGYTGVRAPAVLGIRPQSLRVVDGATQAAGASLRVRVRVVEPLGSEMDIHAELGAGGSAVVARVAARDDVRAGDELHMAMDSDGLHVFAPGEFGATLWSGGRQG